jgi:hypothetical protein
MNSVDANRIVMDLMDAIAPACKQVLAVGSVRRKRHDVHDVEILCLPRDGHPAPEFGRTELMFDTHLDRAFYDLTCSGKLRRVLGGPKMKKFSVNLPAYGLTQYLNDFFAEFYIITPPAQWGVGAVIRTGPGHDNDNFSKYCVTNRSYGGALPDGYKVKHLGVWRVEQLSPKGEPLRGEQPLAMPEEIDFLNFLELGWIEPQERHAPRRITG